MQLNCASDLTPRLSELLLLENVMYGRKYSWFCPREKVEREKQERDTTEERQDMTNVNIGVPCQVIDSKLLRYQCISQIFGREGTSPSENIYITPKSKYHIVRKT